MKTLHLLRHAKASSDDDTLDDKARPLTKRGKRDCALVAAQLQNAERIEYIYCSSARRAEETLQCFQAESSVFDQASIAHDDALYTFDSTALLSWLRELPHDQTQALIIGHNPALVDLANYLYDGKIGHMGTCTFIELEVNVEYWDQLRPDSAKLIDIIRPKQLR